MERIGAFLDEEFESSSRLFSSVEADYFMSHWYGANNGYGNIFTNNEISSSNFVLLDETNLVSINEVDDFASSVHANFQHFSDQNSYSSGSNSPFYPTQGYETNQLFTESNQMQVSIDNILVPTNTSSDENLQPNFRYNVMEEFLLMKEEMVNEKSEHDFNQGRKVADLGEKLTLKRKINMQEHEAGRDEKNNSLSKSPKKPRLPRVAQKGKRNPLSKKNKKFSMNGDDEENNDTIDIQNISSSCSSEDDNSKVASQDCKGEITALNTSGKKRASRGAATDPQSLYARKRRERINERLRILQNIVPNGTKVDISTMLEEAVHYVKFLQLQIKLLGSDEMWMFAPIAYNGMDMGLYNNISI